MQIKLNQQYKSLSNFTSEKLTNFSAIIGKNGSGKTQLLDLINKKEDEYISLITDKKISNIQFNLLDINEVQEVTDHNLIEIKNKIFQDYLKINKASLPYFEYLYKNNLLKKITEQTINDINFLCNLDLPLYDTINDMKLICSSQEYIDIINETFDNLTNAGIKTSSVSLNQFYNERNFTPPEKYRELSILLLLLGTDIHNARKVNFTSNLLYFSLKDCIKFAWEVAKHTNKPINDLEKNDFLITPIDFSILDEYLFDSNLSSVVLSYVEKRDNNHYSYFRKEQNNEINSSISDEEFTDKYPEPWILLNSVFDKYGLNFFLPSLETKDYNRHISYKPYLCKKTRTEEKIDYQDLSSGEKIIIALILSVFNTEAYKESLEYPDLILLDEPDAHLHPEMTYMLIDILNTLFVRQLGIKVIISTHNPSTIALLDEGSIFQLKNGEHSSLKNISKDDALKSLTSFIPTLSINYQNHRQIFVESPTDAEYYQKLYNKLSVYDDFNFSLYFISYDFGEGNCSQVIQLVKDLRISNLKSTFGIIDWDLKNSNTSDNKEYLKVHGEKNRYSIENYLYDPLYLAFLFIQENAYNFKTLLNFELYNEYELFKNSDKAQEAVDLFFKTLKEKDKLFDQSFKTTIETCYGCLTIKTYKEYLEKQGHDLLRYLRTKLDFFNKYTDDKKLNTKMIEIIAKSYPSVPKDTSDLIKELAELKVI